MRISISNLERGIRWWLKGTWPKDFHNNDYYDLYADRTNGVTNDWLGRTVNRLAEWSAIRSPKKPNTKEEILSLAISQLGNIEREYAKIVGLTESEPSVDSVTWQDISALYNVVAEIKRRSAVFASKMCHFIFPRVFIVMDSVATQVMIYEFYWQGMVGEWAQFDEKERAIEVLSARIIEHSQQPIHPHYPYGTKIIELCHAGDKRR